MFKKVQFKKKSYQAPSILEISLDSEISLLMNSGTGPPFAPTSPGATKSTSTYQKATYPVDNPFGGSNPEYER